MGLLQSITVAQSLVGMAMAAAVHAGGAGTKGYAPSTNLKLPYDLGDASAMVSVAMKRPSVVLDDLPSLADVRCADGSVVMTFDDADGLQAVKHSWPSSGDFLVVMSESAGTCSGDKERGFFLLGELRHDEEKLTVTAAAEKRRPRDEIQDAIIDFSRRTKTIKRSPEDAPTTVTEPTADESRSEPLPVASETFDVDLSNTTLADRQGLYLHAERALFTSTLQLDGHLHYNLEELELDEFTMRVEVDYDLDLNVTANIDGRLGLDVIGYSPLSASISAVTIPGIIDIGPIASFSIGVELAAQGPVNTTAGYRSTVEGAVATLNLLDEDGSTASGWSPETSGSANVSTQVALQINPFAELSVGFGVDVFEGTLELTAGISARPTLVNAFVIGSDFSLGGETGVELTGPACPGADEVGGCCHNAAWYESRFWFEVNADLTQFYRVPLYKLDLPIYVGECWAFGDADNATAPVQQKPKCNKKKR
ncbi:hypothetical protein PpBr36_05509 [Pyricularia pennisetigena]|uniref:hypothetical protein n=1 Tax=Pyricularia pennisetigena TaxID=1578925 RepID=UPI0011542CEE|nr:hypothetical protein PpBr36_05509 [Pyricularia pennisetigena]TLS27229.1 hypothetical protein PpBr36_05509 [Pyricularia pennisetigena]